MYHAHLAHTLTIFYVIPHIYFSIRLSLGQLLVSLE